MNPTGFFGNLPGTSSFIGFERGDKCYELNEGKKWDHWVDGVSFLGGR